jgi:hypothetical protein
VREREREHIEADAGADTKTTMKMRKRKNKSVAQRALKREGFSHRLEPPTPAPTST